MLKILLWGLFLPCYLFCSEPKKKEENVFPAMPMFEIPSRITYDINGYDLGDNLMSYVRGKWLSLHYNIPFLYKPFPFANQFVLHAEEKKKFNPTLLTQFELIHPITNEFELCFEDPSNILYLLPCYIEPELFEMESEAPFIELDWETKNFRKLIKKLLKPVDSVESIALPRQRISIAVYMPQYSGKDTESNQSPLQYPPDSYYIEQINKLSELFYHRPFFVYLFTENRNSSEVIKKFQEAMTGHNIIFDYKKSNKMTRNSYVENFINMSKFDCLIRPISNLGFLLEQMNDYLITLKPSHHTLIGHEVYIDEVQQKVREKK
jgi:hypothetical protein